MSDPIARMTNLFLQLGLDASEAGIAKFIAEHPLDAHTPILKASFWTSSQKELLKELLCSDGSWAIVVDQLSEALRN